MKLYTIVLTIISWVWAATWTKKDLANLAVKLSWLGLALWGSYVFLEKLY
jgi:hypothetical protein